MSTVVDIAGQRFGRLVAEHALDERGRGRVAWHCRCDCGKSVAVRGTDLRYGATTSCGCRNREARAMRNLQHGDAFRGKRTPEYSCWLTLKTRCHNPNRKNFADYGGRGIKVCERWHTFENFLADMGRRPSPRHSIDRIDNDRDYGPGNCRWATRTEQARNRRSNKPITLNGVTKLQVQWLEEHGVTRSAFRARLRRGLSVSEALTGGSL